MAFHLVPAFRPGKLRQEVQMGAVGIGGLISRIRETRPITSRLGGGGEENYHARM